jgi:lipid-A-disaccharide synthase
MVAGEPSGDVHGGRLARSMLALDPALELFGMGGESMRAAGLRTLIDSGELSVMGFAELAGSLVRVGAAYRKLKREMKAPARVDLLVLIDFPDFNLRLAAVARRAGVRVLYYVSPQVWAWRRGRIGKICRRVDRMLVLFPFEADLYRAHGLDARFVGHPLAEEAAPTRDRAATRRLLSVPPGRPLVVLLPGSRAREVEHNLPAMLGAARRLAARAAFAVAQAPGLPTRLLERHIADGGVAVALVKDDTYNLLAAADAAAVASGTATVEAAVLGCPMVVVYRMSRASYEIARRLVRVPFIAMPNLILGERVVPELIQAAATPAAIAGELAGILDSEPARRRMVARLGEVRRRLVVPGAATNAARLALEMLP